MSDGAHETFISVLVVGEFRQGVERVRRRDPASAGSLERWLRSLVRLYEGRILPIDIEAANLWGQLSVPNPLPAVDGLMAATAMVHDLTLVTRNARDVARTGVRVIDPFGGYESR